MMWLRVSHLLVFAALLLVGSAQIASLIDDQYCEPEAANIVKLNSTSGSFVIYDPYKRRRLDFSAINCSVILESGPEPLLLEIAFGNPTIVRSNQCSGAYLCVHGVKFCGSWTNESKINFILPEHRQSTILFKADIGVSRRFKISVTTQLAGSDTVVQEPRGLGDGKDNLDFVETTYSPGMPYIDFCSITDPLKLYTLCNQPDSNVINLTPQSPPFLIKSPLVDYHADPFSDYCSVVLTSGIDPLVLTFHFRNLRAKYNAICDSDYICIHGVKFCGNWANGSLISFILPQNRQSTLVLSKSKISSSLDYDILVTTGLADIDTTVLEPQGVGSSEASLKTEHVRYSPWMSFSDNCINNYPVFILCHPTRSNIVELSPDSPPFFILSPNYNMSDYPNNANCSLVLQSGPEPLILTFYFKKFQLLKHYKCHTGSLCIHGVNYCDKWVKGCSMTHILPKNRRSTIFWTTGSHLEFLTFKIRVTIRKVVISQMILEPRGVGNTRKSVSFVEVFYTNGMPYIDFCSITAPRTYDVCNRRDFVQVRDKTPPFSIHSPTLRWPSWMDYCSLVLEAGSATLIVTFYIRTFDLEYNSNCSSGFLCIHGNKLCDRNQREQLFTHILPRWTTSTIIYEPDLLNARSYFEMLVNVDRYDRTSQVNEQSGIGMAVTGSTVVNASNNLGTAYKDLCSENIPPVYEMCRPGKINIMNVNVSTRPFILRSPNWYKQKYGNNRQCTLVLISGSEPLVLTFKYKKFSMESSDACTNDYLCVNRVKLCGSSPKSRVLPHYLPNNKPFQIVFKTNDRVTRSGFEILVTPSRFTSDDEVKELRHYDPITNYWEFELINSYKYYFYNDCNVVSKITSTTSKPHTTSTELPSTP